MNKFSIIAFSFLNFFIASAQNKTCDCLVKTAEQSLEVHLLLKNIKLKDNPAPKPYLYLYPEKGATEAYHKIIKDSAAYWTIQPQVRSKNKYVAFQMEKIPSGFLTMINFNSADSIPVYAEADKKSKVIHYIKKSSNSNEQTPYWFMGCKPGFAKIKLLEKQSQTGWLTKEKYLHE